MTSAATSGSGRERADHPAGRGHPGVPPACGARVPGRIVAVASADSPLKGVATLLRAMAKLVTDTDAHLIVVGKPGRPTRSWPPSCRSATGSRFTSGLPIRGAGRVAGQRRDRRGALAVRGVLAAGGGAHGVRHAAGGQRLRVAARRRPETPPSCSTRDDEAPRRRARRLLGSPPSGPRCPSGRCAGSASGSPGPPWPRPPRSSTGRPSPRAEPGARRRGARVGAGAAVRTREQPPC